MSDKTHAQFVQEYLETFLGVIEELLFLKSDFSGFETWMKIMLHGAAPPGAHRLLRHMACFPGFMCRRKLSVRFQELAKDTLEDVPALIRCHAGVFALRCLLELKETSEVREYSRRVFKNLEQLEPGAAHWKLLGTVHLILMDCQENEESSWLEGQVALSHFRSWLSSRDPAGIHPTTISFVDDAVRRVRAFAKGRTLKPWWEPNGGYDGIKAHVKKEE